MSTEDEYREQAEFCEKMSRRSNTIEARVSWLRLAGKWQALIAAVNKVRPADKDAWSSSGQENLQRSFNRLLTMSKSRTEPHR